MNAKAAYFLSLNWLETKLALPEYLQCRASNWCNAMSEELKGISAWKILLGVCTFFIGVNTSIIGYLVLGQVDLQKQQVALAATTLTAAKGETLMAKLSEIDVKLAALPKENPPQWLLDVIKRNEHRIEKLEVRLERMNGKDHQ